MFCIISLIFPRLPGIVCRQSSTIILCNTYNTRSASQSFDMPDSALNLTLKVLLAIKSAQIEEVVGTLSRDDIDVLMKYIYRGFENPSEGSSGHLLLWHEKAYNVGGSGSIVRVLSDRMRV